MEPQGHTPNPFKVYVDVNEDRLSDGSLRPRALVWQDGVRYPIDQILDIRPAASLKAGGVGMRYTVRIGRNQRYLFFEEDGGTGRWFVEGRGSGRQ
jgi:hypothetical protein